MDEVAPYLVGDWKREDFFDGILKSPQFEVAILPNGVSCPRISSLGLPEASKECTVTICSVARFVDIPEQGVAEHALPVERYKQKGMGCG